MKVIGLTGGIGSGKTTVSQILEILDVPVFYADQAGREVMQEDMEVKNSIINLLGSETYSIDGNPDRKKIASQVFRDAALLRQLNAIIHPAVRKMAMRWQKRNQNARYGIQEIAILFESGAWRLMDHIAMVWAPEALRISRVVNRDQVDEDEVRLRMANQISDDLRLSLSDYVIVNDGTTSLISEVMRVHQILNKI